MLLAVTHSDESGWTEVRDLERLSDIRGERGVLLWAEADVADLDQRDVATMAEEFELHPLAVEDAIHTRQRPKLEPYGKDLFVVLHELHEEDGQLEALQIACFVGPNYILTIHAGADRTLAEAKARWEELDAARRHPGYLLHTLADVVVDDYQRIADRLESEMEELEEIALAEPRAPMQRQLYSLKQRLSRLRRYTLPASRMFEGVLGGAAGTPFDDAVTELFRDVEDHLLRIGDQIRNVEDLSQAVLDLIQSEHAKNLSEISRKLTAWAAIFAVGTLIAGIYGMNFELVPRDGTLPGPLEFWTATGLMIGLGVMLYAYFKRKGWL